MGQKRNEHGPGRKPLPGVHRASALAAAAVTAGAAFVVFLPSLSNEFLLWDDNRLIYENPYIRTLDLEFFRWAFSAVVIASWYPLTLISFALDYAVWGPDPWGFHLTSVVLHSTNTFLVTVLVIRLVRIGRGRGEGLDGTALAAGLVTALLFALHPLRVESVVWAAERKDVLYALFYLLSVLAYLRYTSKTPTSVPFYVASVVLFAMSLMSKPMAVTLPLVLLILDFYPLKRISTGGWLRDSAKMVVEKAPYFILSVAVALVTYWTHISRGAPGAREIIPLTGRFAVAVSGYIFYLKKTLLPLGLAPYYPYPEGVSILSFEYAGSMALFSAVTALALATVKRNRVFAAAWLYYLVALVPVIGSMKGGDMVFAADRYTYLPCLGLFILPGLLAGRAFEGSLHKNLRPLAVAAVLVVSAVLAALTVRQTAVWKDTVTLWSHQIKLYPHGSPLAYNNRGLAYQGLGELELAVRDFSKAIELDPLAAGAYNNRGTALYGSGRYGPAIKDFTRAVELSPGYADAYNNRGAVYMGVGRPKDAIKDYSRALNLNPGDAMAYFNRGIAFNSMGDYEKAVKDYTGAVEIDPRYAEAYNNRGGAYMKQGRLERALRDYTTALELKPGYAIAYFNRGVAHEALGEPDRAVEDYLRALELDPGNAAARTGLLRVKGGGP
jgi:tetratricopeptide (TPR) repeat protein